MKKSKLLLASLLGVSMVVGLAGCGEEKPTPTPDPGPTPTPSHVHNLKKVEAKAATCTEDGHIEYYTCDYKDCVNSYFDKDGKELAYRDIIIPAAHKLTKHEAVEGLLEGSDEYYSCDVCDKYFADADASIEIDEGDWLNEGYAIRYYKDEVMSTKEVNYVSLEEIGDGAIKFDFMMVEDGSDILCMANTTAFTYNVSGEFTITKNGDNYRSTKGIITECEEEGKEGFMTLTINRSEFTGDGMELHGADAVDVIVGGWDHEAQMTKAAGASIFIDPRSFEATENTGFVGLHYLPGDEINLALPRPIAKADLVGKAFELDLRLVTEGTLHFTFFSSSWLNMTGDIAITKDAQGEYSVNKGEITPHASLENYMTYKLNFEDFAGDGLNKEGANEIDVIYRDGGLPTCECWVDFNGTRIADAYPQHKVIVHQTPDNVTMGKVYQVSDFANKAMEMKVCIPTEADTQMKMSFFESSWGKGWACDLFIKQINGVISCEQGGKAIYCEVSAKDADGWFTFRVNTKNFTLGNAFGVAESFSWVMMWEAPNNSAISARDIKAVDEIVEYMGRYFAKDADVNTGGNHITAAQLEGKALQLDLLLLEDGVVHITFFDNTWANMSGDIAITKSGDTYTTTKGKIVSCEKTGFEFYKTLTVNFFVFAGDGLDRGVDIDVIYSDGGKPTTAFYADFDHMRVVDMVPQLQLGDDDWHRMPKITKEGLEGKALQFKAYIPTEDDASIKISFTENGWSNTFIPDIFVKQEASVLTAYQYSMTANNKIGASFSEKVDGYVTVTINFYNITPSTEGNFAGTCITWAATTSGCGVDLASFKAVDEVFDLKTFGNGDFKKFGNTLLQSKLVEEGAISFNVKMEANQTTKVSFMESTWANVGTSIFKSDDSGVVSVFYQNGNTPKGSVTALEDGWYKVVLNENELDGDGRVACGDAFTHFYVENGTISVDGSSFAYCAPHAQTGISYGAGGITVASWDAPQGRNFGYTRAKVVDGNCCISFDFKLEGDGAIQLAIMGNDWANISGEFTITKEGNDVTASYTGAKLVARGEGWYSIYLPAPFPGDGFARDTWTDLSLVYSGGGYSGTSITINWNSFHILNKNCIPQ